MSLVAQVADAVAISLNAQPFDPSFKAARALLPVFDLGKVGQALQVSVVPRSVVVANASRSGSAFDVVIDIGVQRRVDPGDMRQSDELLDLVEQIIDHLRLKRLDKMPDAQWLGVENEPVVAAEHLEQHNVFTSVLSVTYRCTR